MAQSLETPPTPVLDVSPSAADLERDQEAWNLPRQTPVDTVPHGATEEGLDWESFVSAYFPGSRRHNLKALVAYGHYRRSVAPSEERAVEPTNAEVPSIEATSVGAWENEGGASR